MPVFAPFGSRPLPRKKATRFNDTHMVSDMEQVRDFGTLAMEPHSSSDARCSTTTHVAPPTPRALSPRGAAGAPLPALEGRRLGRREDRMHRSMPNRCPGSSLEEFEGVQ